MNVDKIICPNCGIENEGNQINCSTCSVKLLLNDSFYLKKILGENNNITYLGTDINSNKDVIIKELSILSLENWKNRELFNREISVLNSLNHERIPKLIDDFEFSIKGSKSYYLVMELIEGINLKDEILQKRYSEEDALSIIKELTEILKYLHSFRPPIIHRDIKPSNIIRNINGKLVLIDFGAVTDTLKQEGGSTVVGTYGYMAPEQFMGRANIASDYYSLGGILINLLTKQDLSEIIDITDITYVDRIKVSDKMKVILKKLLSLELENRVKTTDEIFELIEKYKNNELKIEEVKAVKLEKEDEKKDINKNNLEDFGKKYFKLKKIFENSVKEVLYEKKKKKKIIHHFPIHIILIAILGGGLSYFEDLLKFGNNAFYNIFILMIIMYINFGILFMLVYSFSYLFNYNYLKTFLNNTVSYPDKELLFVFIKENKEALKLNKYMTGNKILFDRFFNLDKGKLILYERLIKEAKYLEEYDTTKED